MKKERKYTVACPFCGKTLVKCTKDSALEVQCPKCSHYFSVDISDDEEFKVKEKVFSYTAK